MLLVMVMLLLFLFLVDAFCEAKLCMNQTQRQSFCVLQDFPPGDVRMFGVFISEPGRHSLAEDRYVAITF